MNGNWYDALTVQTDRKGNLVIPPFPDGNNPAANDYAAKIKLVN